MKQRQDSGGKSFLTGISCFRFRGLTPADYTSDCAPPINQWDQRERVRGDCGTQWYRCVSSLSTHTHTHTHKHTYPSYLSESVCDGASCVLYAPCFPEGSLSPSTDVSSPELAMCYNLHSGLEDDSGAENDEFSDNGTEVWPFPPKLSR